MNNRITCSVWIKAWREPQSIRTLVITIINGSFCLNINWGISLILVSSYMVSMLWHAYAYHLNYFKSCILIYQHKLWNSYELLVLIFRARSIMSNLGRCMKSQTILIFNWSSTFRFNHLSSDVLANIIWALSILT